MPLLDQLESLGNEFWSWRSKQQPRSHDDIPRIERPIGWVPAWSKSDVTKYLNDISEFEVKLEKLQNLSLNAVIEDQVDFRLLRIAFARVRWELEHLEIWRRFPRFYIDQSIGTIFDYLTPPKIDNVAIDNIERMLLNFRNIFIAARENLTGFAYKEFALVAIEDLTNVKSDLQKMALNLDSVIQLSKKLSFEKANSEAIVEIVAFRDWLKSELPNFVKAKPIGESEYSWFLNNVALIPFTPREIIDIGRLEFDRATYLEIISENKNRKIPTPKLPGSAIEQSECEAMLESQVREFYEVENLLSQPSSLMRYLNAPRPAYLEAIRWLGVTDDLTGPSRLHENGISYVPTPRSDMPYFYAANARDPRLGIVHEGAHYQQLVLSWRNPRTIRRWYYDSGANEGIAFYNEEMLAVAGLFSDSPKSETSIFNLMKLRALRVIIDVSLACEIMTIEDATNFLAKKIPVDLETARDEATFFAAYPGQGITYQIGKTQIITLLSDLKRDQKLSFSLRNFHDYLWINGNVPISLMRWELLKDSNEIEKCDGNSKVVDEIWKNVREMLDCYLNKDRANADKHIHADVTLWDSVEEQLIFGLSGLNALRDRRPNNPDGPKVLKIDNINPVISVINDFAIARYELVIHFEDNTASEHIRNTAIWRKFSSGWKVIHNHEDVIS